LAAAPQFARAARYPEKTMAARLVVESYSGRKADERPVRFRMGDQEYSVEELLDQWYGPDDTYFKVRANDGNFYILRCNGATGEWSLESFRRA
jgi:hypothetical protein